MTCESYPNICIVQGQTYRQTFTADGDWSGAECRGQIRDNWLNSDGAIKAVFEFGSLTYDAETDLTTVEGVVSHQQTTLLPATKYQGVGTQSVRNSLVYDVEIELGDNVYKLAPGYVRVIPEVSDDSVIYDPPIVWDGGINSIELTESNGSIDTYTIWGDAAKTINLGTFDVKNSEGVGIESANYDNSTGVLTFIYTDGSEFSTEDIRGEHGNDGVGIQSTEYDPLTGILTFTFTDNSEFATDDLRGEKGNDGVGIQSTEYNPLTGVLTFTFTDNSTFSTGDLRADLDAATIKTRYESNDNTYAFTGPEKTKLSGLNATDYATAAQGALAETALQPDNIVEFETTTQLNIRDVANRDRVNHTGTQSIATIDGLQSAIDGKQNTLISGTNIKTINGETLLGNGDITINSGGLSNPIDVVYQSIQAVAYNQGGNSTMDNGAYNTFTLTANGTGTTIAHSNVPAAGNRYGFELHLVWTSGTITWPASWTKGDSLPTATGGYVITGVTIDGGTSFKIAILEE